MYAPRLDPPIARAARRIAGRLVAVAFGSMLRARAERRPSTRPLVCLDALETRQLFSAALDLIGVTALRDDPAFDAIDGAGSTVVVIDTGVDFSHSLLSAAKVAEQDFAYGGSTQRITDEHGTHVAGIIAARNEDIGVAPGVGLIGLQVFTESRNGDVSSNDPDIEKALAWVTANRERYNIVAVNMSLGSGNHLSGASARNSILYDDVKRLEAAGVTIVSAAGNSYPQYEREGSSSPAVFSTLDVGAVYEANEGRVGGSGGTDYTTAADRLTYFSQRPNTGNQVFAPGAYIRSTIPGGSTKELAGTSMAAPMVTGTVALMQEAAVTFGGRRLSTDEVRTIVRETADPVVDGDDEHTSVKTTGKTYLRLDTYSALQRVRALFTGSGGGGGGGGGGTEVDPNGTLASATAGPVLGSGAAPAPVTGTIGTDGTTDVGGDDVDLYGFTVNAPGTVTALVDTTAFRSVARVFDSSGAVVQSATAAGDGPLTVTASLAAGAYYLGVSGAPNAGYDPRVAGSGPDGATGAYALSFALDTTDPDGVLTGAADINIAGGDVAQTRNASIGTDGAKAVGGADVDFYRVTVPDDGTLLVDIDTPDPAHADTYLRIFDADGNPVAASDDALATNTTGQPVELRSGTTQLVVDAAGRAQGHLTDSFIGTRAIKGTVYYIAVGNFDNRNFSPTSLGGRVDTGSTGAYRLYVSFGNGDVNGAIPQAVATAELPVSQNAGVLGTDGSAAGAVSVGDRDVDFIKLNAPAAGILKIDIDSNDNASDISDSVDTTVRLFDGEGKLLAFQEDGPDGTEDPLLYYEVDAGTDYYLAVSGAGNDTFDPFLLGSGGQGDTGEYRFSAELLPPSQAAALTDDTSADGGVKDLTVGQQAAGQLGEDNGFVRGGADVDVYRFVAPYTAEFTFTAGPDDAFGADTYLRVFDANGRELAKDDNGGSTGGSKIAVRLGAGQTYLVGVSGAGTAAAAYDPVTGAGAGTGDTGGYVLGVSAGARNLTFDARRKATFTDADGSTVTVSLKGPGSGTVVFDADGNADAASIALNGATDRSSLSVKGDTTVGQVVVTGSLNALSGKAVNLAGDLTITEGARSITLRNVTGSTMKLGGGGGGLAFVAADVVDATLETAAAVRSVKVNSWVDVGGADDRVSSALAVTSVSAKRDFAAGIVAASVGKVSVGGALTGDVRSTGGIGSVTAGSIGGGASVFAGLPSGFTGLPDAPDDFADPTAVLGSVTVKATFSSAYVAAPNVRRATLGAVDPTAAAATGAGGTYGLAADVVGSVTGSVRGVRFRHRFLSDPGQSVTNGAAVIRVV